MKSFDPGDFPKTTEEMQQYGKHLYAVLKADFDKHGIAVVLETLATAVAMQAYQAEQQQVTKKLFYNNFADLITRTKGLNSAVEEKMHLHNLQIKAVSERLEALEGN